MELLALVIINIVFGVILYYAVSIKVTNSVRDYQIVKLKKEIQAHTLTFFKESESYLALMDSRIAVLKNLLHKAEQMGIDFKNLPEQEKLAASLSTTNTESNQNKKPYVSKFDEEAIQDYPQKTVKLKPQSSVIKKTEEEDNGFFSGLIGGLGKGLKSIFGINSDIMIDPNLDTNTKTKKNSVIDVSIGGNPLEATESVQDNLKTEESFQTVFNTVNNPYIQPKQEDTLRISIKAALEELPADATKVEKVVHLLKKGYSHTDISEEMGLAIPEISLIETIKIERSRRI
ncbi:MAG TPA: hypothetical protein PK079_19045 [Leptospiraceae bacterium]|nr:hypothetical protein [Leptospiraceae bacterium]HMW04006.1 hypothetical protein [Leptospiraceae bacterium]HMX30896.1 hypothetical protein [Leptospiraceae bacterium]HMY30000.1 hypothetical protein [Leptospiraceae bacterium]HMZ65362.1 hypothetical protein [Leptospiraceae bacterium]